MTTSALRENLNLKDSLYTPLKDKKGLKALFLNKTNDYSLADKILANCSKA